MAKYEDGSYGSAAGIALIAKVLAGRCAMKYTRVAVGKGNIPDDKTPKTMTEPADYVMDAVIAGITNPVDGECQVTVQINSANVDKGFYCTAVVLYAEDPDEGEVPYTYLVLENEPEWIRPASSIVGKLATIDLIAAVGDVDTVTAAIDPEAIATVAAVNDLLQRHNEDPEAHAGIIMDAVGSAMKKLEESGQIMDQKTVETMIRKEIAEGKILFTVEDEDIHMGIESRLIDKIGDVGKKLHTSRSRNDQCQVDIRLYLRKEIYEILNSLCYLESVILEKAEKYEDKITVGFTHLQHAQPITIGFVFMAYFQMFKRDIERLTDTLERLNYNPLGACALAGTTMPIDRHLTSELLSFTAPTENAMDTVSDRDYSLEFLCDASISMMHLSRWAEEFAWWNSSEFSYIAIDDSFCTGSSIMPQKKNPDMAELIRGKVGRVYGDLMQLLTVMKGTPLAYNKDFQEDKESLFDAIDTWKATIDIFAKMLDKTEFRMDQIEKQLGKGFLNATDIAEHFAKQGIPFREAHAIVGHMVKVCEKKGCDLEDLTDEELQAIDKRVTKELLGDISIKSCVNARVSFGGTAPSEVHRQIEVGRQWLNSLER